MAKVAIVMGSNSDLPVVKGAIDKLKQFGVEYEARVISAHRTPQAAEEFAKGAEDRGVSVIIAAAGKAAHLGGVIAAYTTLPVIALPIKSSLMDGLDSLSSMVQMPSGYPCCNRCGERCGQRRNPCGSDACAFGQEPFG